MPNLRGASPVDRDVGGCSYTTQTAVGVNLRWRRRGRAKSSMMGDEGRAGAPRSRSWVG